MARSLDQLPPEILVMILDDDFDDSELSAVIRVNKLFFSLGIRILWKMNNNTFLAKVSKDRREVYIPLIQELDLTGSPKALYEEFKDSVFPNVKDLSIELKNDQGSIADCRYLTHFMNPGLQLLHFYVGPITADFLLDVPNRCPKLRTVIFSSSSTLCHADGFPYIS